MKNQKGFIALPVLLAILAVLGISLVGGGAVYIKSNSVTSQKPSLTFTMPESGTKVYYGNSMEVSWQETNMPEDATIAFYLNEPEGFDGVGPIDPIGFARVSDHTYELSIDLTDCTGHNCDVIEEGKPYTITAVAGYPKDTTNCYSHCSNWINEIASAKSAPFYIVKEDRGAYETTESEPLLLTFTFPTEGKLISLKTTPQVTWQVPSDVQKKFKEFYIGLDLENSNHVRVGSIGDGYRIWESSTAWNIPAYVEDGFYQIKDLQNGSGYRIHARLQPSSSLSLGCDPNYKGDCEPIYSVQTKQLIAEAKQYMAYGDWFWFTDTEAPSSLTASATSGNVPLTVTFYSTKAYPKGTLDAGIWIDFGDGTTQSVECDREVRRNSFTCPSPVAISHTYTKPGKFIAILRSGDGLCGNECTTILGQISVRPGLIIDDF